MTRRKKLRLFLEELKVEATIMILVIVYALFIFADLLLAGKVPSLQPSKTPARMP